MTKEAAMKSAADTLEGPTS